MTPRVELGCPGHFVGAKNCRWRRHTQVGTYRVSSVGDLYLPNASNERRTLGAGDDSFFETMVFRLTRKSEPWSEGCGCKAVKDWSEVDVKRYATAGEAQAGHEAMVSKYQRKAK